MIRVEDRFMGKVDRSPDGCWLWTGAVNHGGYGLFHRESQHMISAHRWSYEYFVGPIPEGLHIDHLCRVRSCVNPHHLYRDRKR